MPHDDRLEERKFAFIFYLSPEWREEFGGLLHLFDHIPEENRPITIAKSLLPKSNSFVFFQVKANSWHAVSEVLSEDKPRLSLNGWFHADNTPPAPEPTPESFISRVKPSLDITVSSPQNFKAFSSSPMCMIVLARIILAQMNRNGSKENLLPSLNLFYGTS